VTPVLEARDIIVERSGKRLLDGLSVRLTAGRVWAVSGPNGAGKTTLLRVLAGELRASRGTVTLDGVDLASLPPGQLARRRAVVPQASLLAFPFTALEVVLLGITVPGFAPPAKEARERAADALASVGLRGFEDRFYQHLSGGERQRVHVARALCQLSQRRDPEGAPVLLLDEPTSSLDLAHQMDVLAEVRRCARRGWLVLVILHDLNLAATFADELILLDRGRVAAAGAPAEVIQDNVLSPVYRCALRSSRIPRRGVPFLLPQTIRGEAESLPDAS
jgi:iron complex transport system ATP-binding protein